MHLLQRELTYIWYYFDIQFRQIFWYWVFGMVFGSAISVFFKEKIHQCFVWISEKNIGVVKIFIVSALGIISPLCMYGTIPIAASFSKSGMKDDTLSAFMMSSVLLNPQLIIYSVALGNVVLAVRVITCFLCGVCGGLIIRFFYKDKSFFCFEGFQEPINHDVATNLFIRYINNLGRNVKATGVYFLFGILLSALFQRYVPANTITMLFGGNEAFGVLMAATIGVPLYACGGGTIPLLQQWLLEGMSIGSATSFMLTGPATKITNLSALKIILGGKRFFLYLVYIMIFSFAAGSVVSIVI